MKKIYLCRMSTREKILSVALELFNQYGHSKVGTRKICERAGISPGNLTYHFPKKEAITMSLYEQLVGELDQLFESSAQAGALSLQAVYQGILGLYCTMHRFRFLLIDFVGIMREIPVMNQHFRVLMNRRQQEFTQLFQLAVQSGTFKLEEYQGQYQSLHLQMSVYGDYWLSHGEVTFRGSDEEKIKHYAEGALSMFYPILTEKAKEEYFSLLGIGE